MPVRSLLLLLLAVSWSISCSPKPPPDEPAQPTVSSTPDATVAPPPSVSESVQDVQEEPWGETQDPEVEKVSNLAAEAERFNGQSLLRTVFFATNRSDLQPEARELLARNGAWLRGHPEFAVTIEGHCDERNTEEYNLALGDRRANAVSTYLISLGITANRLETISYGEERPVDPRNSEGAWSKNRRAEFILKPM